MADAVKVITCAAFATVHIACWTTRRLDYQQRPSMATKEGFTNVQPCCLSTNRLKQRMHFPVPWTAHQFARGVPRHQTLMMVKTMHVIFPKSSVSPLMIAYPFIGPGTIGAASKT